MSSQQVSYNYIYSVYQSRKVLLELMKKQGFNIEEYESFSISEVSSMLNSKQLDMYLEKKGGAYGEASVFTTSAERIYICYSHYPRITPNDLGNTIKDLYNSIGDYPNKLTTNDTLMIIIKDDPNDTMIETLKHIWETEEKHIIVHSIKRLQFNILNHSLVPPHRILSKMETEEVMAKYNIDNIVQFPEISRFDPVTVAIGMKPNEVCEILRPSKTSIIGYYYRICV